MPKIYLMHAYSPKNSGDGLLVKLSLQLINERVNGDVHVVCLDPLSFKTYLGGYDCRVIGVVGFLCTLVMDFLLRRKVAFFAVGGGYMRASNFTEGAKTFLAHGVQLLFSILLFPSSKKIYLPQSIGPLRGVWGRMLKLLLDRVDVICCRDDKTLLELGFKSNARRVPDLVVIEILKNFRPDNIFSSKAVGMIMRDLPAHKKGKTYVQRMRNLYDLLSPVSLVVQSEGRGNDDIAFYKRNFPTESLVSKDSFLMRDNALVISVRLHGSLECLLSGFPSVHIAYERKGSAAYSDLGLSEYCFHVSDFDPVIVAGVCEKILSDPNPFWARIKTKACEFEDPFQDIFDAWGSEYVKG